MPPPARPSSFAAMTRSWGSSAARPRSPCSSSAGLSWLSVCSWAGRIAVTCVLMARSSDSVRDYRAGTCAIPPEECIQCKLCVESCPYGAIREPTVEMAPEDRVRGRRLLAAMLVLLPILVGAGFALGLGLAFPLARLHPDVRLAEYAKYIHRVEQLSPEAVENPTEFLKPRADAVEAFRKTGQSVTELDKKARSAAPTVRLAGWRPGGLGWAGDWGQACHPLPAPSPHRLPARQGQLSLLRPLLLVLPA